MPSLPIVNRFSKVPRWLCWIFITLYYFAFFCKKTILTASDLGRHITNGRTIMEQGWVFTTNLYSYTFPDRFAPNHHWLFGVIVHYIHDWVSFSGLTLLSALLYTSATALVFWRVTQKFGRKAVLLTAIVVLPFITSRSEVRPEAFSLFFFAAQIILMLLWYEKKISLFGAAIGTFLVGVAWVNIHIFFFMQAMVIGAFGLQTLIEKKWRKLGWLMVLGLVGMVGSCINPLGLQGVLYPFNILREYGYPVAENQSIIFFLRLYPSPYYWYLAIGCLLTTAASLFLIKKDWKKYFAQLVLFFVLLIMLNKMVRFSNFFGIIATLVFAPAVQIFFATYQDKIKRFFSSTVGTSLFSFSFFVICSLCIASQQFLPIGFNSGFGLSPRVQNSAEFFKTLTVTGPIFNNFDIGGYLIYHLYPKYQIYVDNRAEAYPAEFLAEYKDAQSNPEVWKQLDEKYKFGAVYFFRHDGTDWAQAFLIFILENKDWVPIYVDEYAIIFIKNIPEHAKIIEAYQLPADMFEVTTIDR